VPRSTCALRALLFCCAALPAAADVDLDELLSRMTTAEKVGQLVQQRGYDENFPNPGDKPIREVVETAIANGEIGTMLGVSDVETVNRLQRFAVEESRLGIPLAIANDIIHGCRTIFPIPLAEAASWNLDLIERTARIAAIEASAAGTHWNFAPMVDISRDPRWGRIAEGAGEDPFLGGLIAAARVRGFQGDDLSAPDTLLACAKHYIAYGGAEAGRDYNTVDISERTLRETYLPPFAAAIEAGVGSIMTAFNEIGGVPQTGDVYTLRTILRGELGFDGVLVSDYTSIEEMIDTASRPTNAGRPDLP
jgi:beta-glucosidase